jgi:tetratricopeptide (TPR) repeat protein
MGTANPTTRALAAAAVLAAVGVVRAAEPQTRPAAETRPALPRQALLDYEDLRPTVERPANPDRIEPVPDRAKKLVVDAYKHIVGRDYAEAVNLLERAIGFDPTNPRIQRALGVAYAGLGDNGRAETNLRAAVAVAPDDLEAQLLLGILARRNRQPDRAILALRTALKTTAARPAEPLAAEAVVRLADALEDEGYLTAALDLYERLAGWTARHASKYTGRKALKEIVLRPELLLSKRGALLLRLRRHREAIGLLDRSYRLNRTHRRTAALLVAALLETEQFDRAEALLVDMAGEPTQRRQVPSLVETMVRLSGDERLPAKVALAASRRRVDDAMGIALADVAERLGDRAQAAEILGGLLEAMPGNGEVAGRLARLYARQGRPRRGLDVLAEALAADPEAHEAVRQGVDRIAAGRRPAGLVASFAAAADANDSPAAFALHYVAGRLAQQAGEPNLALSQYRRTCRKKDDFLPAYAALAGLHFDRGDLRQVEAVLAKAAEAGADGHVVSYFRGRLALARGRTQRALAALRRARRQDASHLPTLGLLAEAYLRGNQSQEAARVLRQAAELQPANEQITRRLFDLYLAGGRIDQAERVLQEFRKHRPKSLAGHVLEVRLLLAKGNAEDAGKLLAALKRDAKGAPDVVVLDVRVRTGPPGSLPYKATFDEATQRLEDLLADHPGDADARALLADLYGRAGRHEQAARHWRRIYERTPWRADVAGAYAEALRRSQRHAEAAAVLRRELAYDPNDAVARLRLIDALKATAGYDEAEAALRQWIEQAGEEPERLRYRLLLQDLYEQAERYDKLHELLDAWIAAEQPGRPRRALRARKLRVHVLAGQADQGVAYARAWMKEAPGYLPAAVLARALLDANEHRRAVAELDRWIADAPEEEGEPLRALKVAALAQAGELESAERYALKWLRDAGGALPPRRALIDTLIEADALDRAEALLTDWLAAAGEPNAAATPASADANAPATAPETRPAPTTAPATGPASAPTTAPAPARGLPAETVQWLRRTRLRVLIERQQYARALSSVKEYLAQNPDNVDLLELKSVAAGEANRPDEALAAMERAHRLSEDGLESLSTANNLSYAYADRGVKLDRAEALIISAVRRSPNPAFVDTLGWVYYKRGKLPRAGAVFRDLLGEIADDPGTHPVMLDHGGDAFYRLGWLEKAKAAWRRGLAEARKDPRPTLEVRAILKAAPKKLEALREGKVPPAAPLGEGAAPDAPPPG